MTTDQAAEETYKRGMRRTYVVMAAFLVALAAVIALVVVHQQQARDARIDTLTCTLSGMGPMNVGPRTGRLCADLLRN